MTSILLVEDSAVTRAVIRRAVELSDVPIGAIHEAANGAEAFEILTREHVDVMITDINMPVMTGMELLRRMTTDGRWRHVKRVVMSTDGSSPRRAEACALGVRLFIEKPCRPEAIRDVLCCLASR